MDNEKEYLTPFDPAEQISWDGQNGQERRCSVLSKHSIPNSIVELHENYPNGGYERFYLLLSTDENERKRLIDGLRAHEKLVQMAFETISVLHSIELYSRATKVLGWNWEHQHPEIRLGFPSSLLGG